MFGGIVTELSGFLGQSIRERRALSGAGMSSAFISRFPHGWMINGFIGYR